MFDGRVIERRLSAALDRRSVLLADADLEAVRLFHGRADGIEGLVVERWGPALVVQLHEGLEAPDEGQLRPFMEAWRNRFGAQGVYLKRFVRDRGGAEAEVGAGHRESRPWIGEAVEEEVAVREGRLRFLIRPHDGFSVGLFLEQRENRRRIGELATGRRVLNAFAYTCGFSVAAALGGAESVASVDLSKHYLEWGKRNFVVNGVPSERHRFYCSDVLEFFKRARRQGLKFGLAIVDPPTFSRRRRPAGVFELRVELPRLIRETIDRLDPGGILFFSTNDRQMSREEMEGAIRAGTEGRRANVLERPELPEDFGGDEEYSRAIIVRFE